MITGEHRLKEARNLCFIRVYLWLESLLIDSQIV
ncbi:hypothetical protein BH18ACI2_BH18ACI2_08720 [soil metagenome]